MPKLTSIARHLAGELATDARGYFARFENRARAIARLKQATNEATGAMVEMIRGGSKYSRRKINPKQVLEVYQTSAWFQAVVQRAAFAAAVVPWRLFAVKPSPGSKAHREGRAFAKHAALQSGGSLKIREDITKVLEHQNRLREIEEHLLFDLLESPNPILTGIDVLFLTFASLLVVGEMGWAIERNGMANAPSAIWPVPSHWITKTPADGISGYEVQIGSDRETFALDEFILFRNPNLASPYGRGTGHGSAMADELETDEYIAKFQNAYFIHGGAPDLLVVAKPGKDGTPADKDEVQLAQEKFNNMYSGVHRGRGSFWTRADIMIHELQQKLIDLDLTEQRTWIKKLAREVVGVPPEIMGEIENSNRSTIDQAFAILAMVSTVPQCERVRAQMQMQLVPMFDDRLALGYWSPVPDDYEFQLKAMVAAPWASTRGEWRNLQGLEVRGKADEVHMQPMNLLEVPAPARKPATKDLPKPTLVRELPHTITKLNDADIEAAKEALTPYQLERELKPEVSKTIEKWANATLVDLGVEPNFNMGNPRVLEYLREFSAKRIADMNTYTQSLVGAQLEAGVAAGEGPQALATRIRSLFKNMSRTRAITIARTETNPAANFGNLEAMSVSGLVEGKGWVSTIDTETREAHEHLNGDEVKIGEPFVDMDGNELQYPGDPSAPAEAVINCRCALIGVVKGKSFARAEFVKSWLEETDADIKRIARAARRAFRVQMEAVLEVLEEAA